MKVGGFLWRGTRGLLRGVIPSRARAVRLGEWVWWRCTSIWPKSEPVGPAFDHFTGDCAELKRPVKLVNNPKRARPPKPQFAGH